MNGSKITKRYVFGLVFFFIYVIFLFTTIVLTSIYGCDGVCQEFEGLGLVVIIPFALTALVMSVLSLVMLLSDRYGKNGSTGKYHNIGKWLTLSIVASYAVIQIYSIYA